MNKRIQSIVTIHTAQGPTAIVRKGELQGDPNPAGMIRVQWAEDGYGRMGWVRQEDTFPEGEDLAFELMCAQDDLLQAMFGDC